MYDHGWLNRILFGVVALVVTSSSSIVQTVVADCVDSNFPQFTFIDPGHPTIDNSFAAVVQYGVTCAGGLSNAPQRVECQGGAWTLYDPSPDHTTGVDPECLPVSCGTLNSYTINFGSQSVYPTPGNATLGSIRMFTSDCDAISHVTGSRNATCDVVVIDLGTWDWNLQWTLGTSTLACQLTVPSPNTPLDACVPFGISTNQITAYVANGQTNQVTLIGNHSRVGVTSISSGAFPTPLFSADTLFTSPFSEACRTQAFDAAGAAFPCDFDHDSTSGVLDGVTLQAGVHCATAGFYVRNTVTLVAGNDPLRGFQFRTNGNIVFASNASIIPVGTGLIATHIHWICTSDNTISMGDGTTFPVGQKSNVTGILLGRNFDFSAFELHGQVLGTSTGATLRLAAGEGGTVYWEAPLMIDCQVSEWINGTCSVTCGPDGVMSQNRTILTPASGGGTACPTTLQQTVPCDVFTPCPIDCVVSNYTDPGCPPVSSPTGTLCGPYVRNFTRTIITAAQYNGVACPPLTLTVDCGFPACPLPLPNLSACAPFAMLADQIYNLASPGRTNTLTVYGGSNVSVTTMTSTSFAAGTRFTKPVDQTCRSQILAARADGLYACTVNHDATNGILDGVTLTPGVHCASNTNGLTFRNQITLDGQGDPTATFVFTSGGDITFIQTVNLTLTNGTTWQRILTIVTNIGVDFKAIGFGDGTFPAGNTSIVWGTMLAARYRLGPFAMSGQILTAKSGGLGILGYPTGEQGDLYWPIRVDCVVSPWVNGTCSVSCGSGGVMTQNRTVLDGPFNGGSACPALSQYPVACDALVPCPIECVLSVWSDFSACDATTCGGQAGTRNQTRTVLVDAQFGAAPCSTNLTNVVACVSDPCSSSAAAGDSSSGGDSSSSVIYISSTGISDSSSSTGDTGVAIIPRDCEWSEWFNVTDCDCTHVQTQLRNITVTPLLDGVACPDSLNQTVACNPMPSLNCTLPLVGGDPDVSSSSNSFIDTQLGRAVVIVAVVVASASAFTLALYGRSLSPQRATQPYASV